VSGIDVPTEVYEALEAPEDERDGILRRELAVSRYREDYLSFGTARELARLSKAKFHRLIGRRSVERHYADDDLEDDRDYASG